MLFSEYAIPELILVLFSEYVIPMMTTGISEHWDRMEVAMAETAIYASLQITLYIAFLLSDAPLTSFPVTNEKETGG